MTHNVLRRTLTNEQLNAGYCGPEIGMSWNIVGAQMALSKCA